MSETLKNNHKGSQSPVGKIFTSINIHQQMDHVDKHNLQCLTTSQNKYTDMLHKNTYIYNFHLNHNVFTIHTFTVKLGFLF